VKSILKAFIKKGDSLLKLPYCSCITRKKRPLNKDKYLIILMLGFSQVASYKAAPDTGLVGHPIYKELSYA
jgi:hypothetical protein